MVAGAVSVYNDEGRGKEKMTEEEKELDVDLESKGDAETIIALLESTIHGLLTCTHRFSIKLKIKDLGDVKSKP